jgi:hypothetical protein
MKFLVSFEFDFTAATMGPKTAVLLRARASKRGSHPYHRGIRDRDSHDLRANDDRRALASFRAMLYEQSTGERQGSVSRSPPG